MTRRIAVAVTTLIGGLAFYLSFVTVTDLAHRAGYHPEQAWAWPVIVDGLIVVAELAVFAQRGRLYAWVVLVGATGVSGAANIVHAAVTPTELSLWITGPMAAMPSVALLVATHLTVTLTQRATPTPEPPAATHPPGAVLTEMLKHPHTHQPTRPRLGADWAITGGRP